MNSINLPDGAQSILSMTASTFCTTGDYTVTVKVDATGNALDKNISFVLRITSGGGGGGSIAAGSLVTLADGTKVPVQNLKIGDKVLAYDTTTRQTVLATITEIRTVTVDNLVIIRLLDGTTLRTGNNPLQRFWTMKPNGTIAMVGVPDIQVGDYLFNVATRSWVQVVKKQYITGGIFEMFDIVTTALTTTLSTTT